MSIVRLVMHDDKQKSVEKEIAYESTIQNM